MASPTDEKIEELYERYTNSDITGHEDFMTGYKHTVKKMLKEAMVSALDEVEKELKPFRAVYGEDMKPYNDGIYKALEILYRLRSETTG